MSEINKSYRIKTNVGTNLTNEYITIDANLLQDYDTFDILSVKIDSVDTYKLHNANYGVVVGRVLANNGFGIPNAKISIFIPSDGEDGEKVNDLYPFTNSVSKDRNGVRYNLLPDEQVGDCHQIVGTFPNKRYALDNDVILEVFDKYYKYTTRTNGAGDYLIMGIPVGTHTLHMDLDLSDCGILSQRPRDFVYKGYTIEQFENPNMFKDGTAYSNLSQIFTQDQVVNVQPFWGNSSLGEKIGITRADIDVAFKFEPTCVFIGSVVSDNSSQGISKKCIATENMGNMEELTTGEGTIEMIRKTPGGSVEEFQVKGAQLIDGNGIWCYQIPMNLDYMMTDEYGNMVPTDNPEKGIPTRTKVRFRVSMQDNEENVDNYFRAKVLVPHNPQNLNNGNHEEYDYEFGSLTREDSFRDLFWNNVYSVKTYIPRFQKRKVGGWKEKKFTGIKNCNFYGSNNPMPYNNIRIKLPFMFTVMCALIKIFIFIVSIMNSLTSMLGNFLCDLGDTYIGFHIWKWDVGFYPFHKLYNQALSLSMNVLKEGLCPDLENWYFAPMFKQNLWSSEKKPPKDYPRYDLLKQTLQKIRDASADDDEMSIDYQNNEEMDAEGQEPVCLTIHTDYLIACVEMNLAMEYRVINFDFYNDWVNGTLYFPRFMRYIRPKKTFLGITFAKAKVKGCMDDTRIFSKTRRYTQQCALGYKNSTVGDRGVFTTLENPALKTNGIKIANNLHKQRGLSQKTIFGKNGGICHEQTTFKGQQVYYMKPCEWTYSTTPNARKVNLFATDIILLGSLNDCDINGVPQSFKYLSSTSYIMPTNLALTNMETNGWLYTTGKGTICAGKSYLSENDVKAGDSVNIASPNSGLTTEILAYSGAQDSNYNVQYDGNELSDIIALTEAAGIAWNYTGPGQGEINEKQFYYPGGHFLGLSCINSQTNIKSCINLSRICEVGANLSQRKEDISKVNAETGEMEYTYTVPTGFISGDDIVGANFRTMFATMNHNRLIANKTNPLTGYKMYGFEFLKPINFDGSFKTMVDGNSLYNGKISVPKENDNIFQKIGIALGIGRDDYDANESEKTQTRTIENPSIDYYLYRFGLTYEDLKKTNQLHQRKFLLTDNNQMYLPQYENSYYFYFGLKNGATAIDEFNKQFFSECDNGKLSMGEPIVNISVDGDINICEAKANITVATSNLEVPYQYIEVKSDVMNTIFVTNGDDETQYDHWLTSYMFELSNVPLGNYEVTIRDANDVQYTKKASIGMDLLSFESEAYDFNNSSDYRSLGNTIHQGGYIKVSNVKVDGLTDGQQLTIYIKGVSASEIYKNGENKEILLKVNNPGDYELRLKYKCSGAPQQDILMQTFTIKDNSYLSLYMGEPDLVYEELMESISVNNLGDNDHWLERICTFNEISNVGKETTSMKTFANGGAKVVWGLPQNNEGILTGETYCSENSIDIPNGYVVDDEFVYYPTYKYNGSEVTPFSVTVYNGNTVMGNYAAYLSDGSINGALGIKNGEGYVFKPIPDGDLQFHVYNGGLTYNKQNDDGTDIVDGVFYPSISYHSINRPFCAETNFYVWQHRKIEMMADENGEESPNVMDYEEAGRTEMTVINGITYNNSFYADSFIANLEHKKPYKVNKNDMYDVESNSHRITTFNGYNENVEINNSLILGGESGITNFGYELIEGCEKSEYVSIANTLSNVLTSTFADYATYYVEDGKLRGPVMAGGTNANGSNVNYYLCVDKNSSLLTTSKDKYMYVKNGDRTYFVVCTYTSAATYNVEGSTVIATVTFENNNHKKANCSYSLKNEEGSTYVKSTNKIDTYKSTIEEELEDVFNACPEIQGVVNYQIKDVSEWAEKIVSQKWSNPIMPYTNGIIYAVGEIKSNNTTLYKIYPNTVKISKYKEVEYVEVSVIPENISVGADGGSVTVIVKGGNTIPWIADYDSNWFSVNPTNGQGVNGTNVTITVQGNDTSTERSGTVVFYTNSPYDGAILTITQGNVTEKTVDYTPTQINSHVRLSLSNGQSKTQQTGSTYVYSFDFTDAINKEVTLKIPSLTVNKFDFNKSLIDAYDNNFIEFSFKIINDTTSEIVKTVTSEKISNNGTYSFNDIIFTPNSSLYSLIGSYTVNCGDTNVTDKQYVETLFKTTTNNLYYKYKG